MEVLSDLANHITILARIVALCWKSPYFEVSLFGGCQSEAIQPETAV